MTAKLLFSGTTTLRSLVLMWLILWFISGDRQRHHFEDQINTPVLTQGTAVTSAEAQQEATCPQQQPIGLRHQPAINSGGFTIGLPY